MDLQSNGTVSTFSKRANTYDSKMEWVNLPACLEPMIVSPFGKQLCLDVCAGTGAVSSELIKNGWNVISLDVSKDMLKKGCLPFPVIGDIHFLPFLDDFFDLVVCRQGLQYSDLSVAISELVRVSSKRVIIGHITKVEGDNFSFWDDYFKIASPGRKHIFLPNQLVELIRSLGFKCNIISIINQQDNFVGPIVFLDKNTQKKLVNMLLQMPDDFKRLYNVREESPGEIQYSNRWEFISIEK